MNVFKELYQYRELLKTNVKKENDIAIKVSHMTKNFKLYSDKPNTLKERIVRGW